MMKLIGFCMVSLGNGLEIGSDLLINTQDRETGEKMTLIKLVRKSASEQAHKTRARRLSERNK